MTTFYHMNGRENLFPMEILVSTKLTHTSSWESEPYTNRRLLERSSEAVRLWLILVNVVLSIISINAPVSMRILTGTSLTWISTCNVLEPGELFPIVYKYSSSVLLSSLGGWRDSVDGGDSVVTWWRCDLDCQCCLGLWWPPALTGGVVFLLRHTLEKWFDFPHFYMSAWASSMWP